VHMLLEFADGLVLLERPLVGMLDLHQVLVCVYVERPC
jgi:hypothetical protein